MIKVCDSIMGSGKTQAVINHLNTYPLGKYIYISPYLDESSRIKDGCPSLRFHEPEARKEYDHSKLNHTKTLIDLGVNIASTHQAFRSYTPEMLEEITDKGYTLIVDECISSVDVYTVDEWDLKMALDAGYIDYDSEDNSYKFVNDVYRGSNRLLSDMFDTFRTHPSMMAGATCRGQKKLYYWTLPAELLKAFKDVYILTYMFEGQGMHNFLKLHGLEYENIYIEPCGYGTGYRFCDHDGYVPDYVPHIHDMIEIFDNDRINCIGDDPYALSKKWFEGNGGGVEQLRRNMYNVFRNYWKGSKPDTRMWSTFKHYEESVCGKGFMHNFVPLNMKSTNTFSSAVYLAYACNVFMNVGEKTLYQKRGVAPDDDAYALSIMVQWIWRSAIRKGERIHLYLPSSRMRRILTEWMEKLEGGGVYTENEKKVS